MKKILLMLCVLTLLVGCEKNVTDDYDSMNTSDKAQSLKNDNNEFEIVDEGQYYRLKKSDGAYFYEILDDNGNIVKTDGSYTKEPHISMLNDTTVKVSYQAGTGLSTRWTFYYDTISSEFSPEYYSVFGESDGNVIYRSGSSIIVSDIFDKTKCYIEISKFKHPISEAAEPFINAEIDESGSMIKITYLTGDNFVEVTEYFDIGDNGWKGAYKAALETFRQSVDFTEDSLFSLRDINGDDIPELFISEGYYHSGEVHIYTFDGELTEIGEKGSNGKVLYCADSGILLDGYMQGGEDHRKYYRLESDLLTELAYFYNDSGRPGTTVYKINDVEISEEEYNSELGKYEGDFIFLGRDFQFTDEFIEAALSEKDNWYDVYSELLYGLGNSNVSEKWKFSLYDINGDDIPELLISEGSSRVASCQIYSFHNGFIGLGGYGTYGCVLFNPNLNLITGDDLIQGYDYSFEYSLGDDFAIVLERSFYNNKGAAASTEETEYKIDGELVSAEEYQTEFDRYHDEDSISLGWDYNFTDEDISKALAEYETETQLSLRERVIAEYKSAIDSMTDSISGNYTSFRYSLFDMNCDGIPELIIKYEDKQTAILTYRDGKARLLADDLGSDWTYFAYDTAENKLILAQKNYGWGKMTWYDIDENGELRLLRETDEFEYEVEDVPDCQDTHKGNPKYGEYMELYNAAWLDYSWTSVDREYDFERTVIKKYSGDDIYSKADKYYYLENYQF